MNGKSSVLLKILILTLSISFLASGPKNDIGVVALVDGDVWKISDSGSKNFLNNTSKIYEGDKIITSESGYIKILMNDDTVFDLGGASKFTFEEFKMKTKADRKAKYNLGYGQMRSIFTVKAKDEKSLQIKTPDVVMGVRGTEFLTSHNSSGSKVVLLQGSLNVKSKVTNKVIHLGVGNMFNSSSIKGPKGNMNLALSKINKLQMKQMKIGKLMDQGAFIQSVMSPGEKFPVSKEMKKEMKSKPRVDAGSGRKKDIQKGHSRARKDPRRSNIMRARFVERMREIENSSGSNSDIPGTTLPPAGGPNDPAGCEPLCEQ